MVQGHSPFKELVNRFGDKFIVALGKGEPAAVMTEYGFKRVVSTDEYESYFNGIDPLSQYKTWGSKQIFSEKYYVRTDKVQAVFVVSDPVDWGRDIQRNENALTIADSIIQRGYEECIDDPDMLYTSIDQIRKLLREASIEEVQRTVRSPRFALVTYTRRDNRCSSRN
ncbi:hypothetical protein MRB53_024792 [Persea americana]|uniref:Uncharacterized protein n=1 Tax=Persea americana TaxID=3435 RepID=A0ACC2LEL7_PERAE|nr:hypothetical protein MRB53_024792 [Persea americana]